MITDIRLDGEQLTNGKRFCQAIRNLNFPEVDWSSNKKGSFFGRNLSKEKIVSNRFAMEFQVVGDDFSDIADQRESFVEIISRVISDGEALLEIDKSNGVKVQANVRGIDLSGDTNFADPLNAKMLVEFETERPFLESQTLYEENGFIFQGGGTPVPMPIPLDMSVGGTNELSLDVAGNYEAFPIFTFYGLLVNPSLYNASTDKLFNLNLTLNSASDIVEVDTYYRVVRYLPSLGNARQYASGDFWTLTNGINLIHLGSGNVNPYGKVKITYRETFLGI